MAVCRIAFVVTAGLALAACSKQAPAPSPQAGDAQGADVAPAPVAPAPPTETPAGGTLSAATFSSASLGVDKRYNIYLPAGYEANPDRRYPVLYLLHGLGGDEDNWPGFGLVEAADAAAFEAIVVMPDGDDSFYANWVGEVDYDQCMAGPRPFGRAADMATYCVRSARYEDYIAADLVRHVDEAYRTVASSTMRAIGGFSMGGFGALMLSMRHPEVFGTAVSHAGVAALRYAGPDPYAGVDAAVIADDAESWMARLGRFGVLYRRIFGTDLNNWKAHDPAALVAEVEPNAPALYLDCGTEDGFRLNVGAEYVHDLLAARDVPHAFTLTEGRHDPAFVRKRLPESLAFVAAQFAKRGPARNP